MDIFLLNAHMLLLIAHCSPLTTHIIALPTQHNYRTHSNHTNQSLQNIYITSICCNACINIFLKPR